ILKDTSVFNKMMKLRQKMRPLALKIEKRSESLEEGNSSPIEFYAKKMSNLKTDEHSQDFSFSKL
ncbi:MAG: hypothetical protein ACK55Z_03515, partial [bacterium]